MSEQATVINNAIAEAIAQAGGASKLAQLRGLKTPWTVRKWIRDGLPAEHVIWLSELTGWRSTPHQLAPDIYPHPDDGLPANFRAAVN